MPTQEQIDEALAVADWKYPRLYEPSYDKVGRYRSRMDCAVDNLAAAYRTEKARAYLLEKQNSELLAAILCKETPHYIKLLVERHVAERAALKGE